MPEQLTRFKVVGLHKRLTFDIPIVDNCLILVGENGLGKTTILRLLYCILSGKWSQLPTYNFHEITLDIGGRSFTISRQDLDSIVQEDVEVRMSPAVRRRFGQLKLELADDAFDDDSYDSIMELSERYSVPPELVFQVRSNADLFQAALSDRKRDLLEYFDSDVLYLPTYRRIERELKQIMGSGRHEAFSEKNRRHVRNDRSIELVEFGMKDVEKSILTTLQDLKEFARSRLNALTLGYLGEIVENKYKTADIARIQGAAHGTFDDVLHRIPDGILSIEQKRNVLLTIQNVSLGVTPDQHELLICHYILRLLEFQEELREREGAVRKFVEICNGYFAGGTKSFFYDSDSFSLRLASVDEDSVDQCDVELSDLSSGEKQIVSLFSHLLLSTRQRCLVIIDEPELSLSVPWQRRFLYDIRDSGRTSGMIAATHSPFVYEGDLRAYAFGLGEFSKVWGD